MCKKKNNGLDNKKMDKEIEFTEYAPINQEYSKQELAEIYKRIIKDIQDNKR
jgi:hypothetical protein